MTEQSGSRMNILAIKSVDPYAKDIVDGSDRVAVFTFDQEKNGWEKKVLDAQLFIYRRHAEPSNSLFINYILNAEPTVEPISARMKLKIDPPFLFTNNEQNHTRGFRFVTVDECNRISKLVERAIGSSNQLQLQQSNKNAGIMSLLAKAQENLDNTVAGHGQDGATQQIKSPAITNMASPSVMNFFASAAKPASNDIPISSKIMSEPVHVDQIEKHQQRATPREKFYSPTKKSVNNIQRIHSPKRSVNHSTSTCSSTRLNTAFTELSELCSSVDQISMQDILGKNDQTADQAKPAFALPTLLSVTKSLTMGAEKATLPPIPTKKLLTSNGAEIKQTNGSGRLEPEPLTHNQLLQAMTYLMKTDADFVKKLHEAYLLSLNEMLSK